MADDELASIRSRRLAEIQQQQQQEFGAGNESNTKAAEDAQKAAEFRHSILSQVLDQQARARLNTIAIAKPDKAKMIENMLMNMARMGQIQNKLNEEQLVSLLSQINQRTKTTTTVKFDRRRATLDSDEDF